MEHSEKSVIVAAAVIIFISGYIAGAVCIGGVVDKVWQKWALDNHYAEYNQRTGQLYYINNTEKLAGEK